MKETNTKLRFFIINCIKKIASIDSERYGVNFEEAIVSVWHDVDDLMIFPNDKIRLEESRLDHLERVGYLAKYLEEVNWLLQRRQNSCYAKLNLRNYRFSKSENSAKIPSSFLEKAPRNVNSESFHAHLNEGLYEDEQKTVYLLKGEGFCLIFEAEKEEINNVKQLLKYLKKLDLDELQNSLNLEHFKLKQIELNLFEH